ncbi:hypothetical protein M5X00_28355 [Paenibacillus alvei]|uniref:hypothetical protein n=1 Tax=Paenibacillus alvei TaxID=44250 RepID=UPI0002885ECA|nr:hypothetical protein [Paenibacillus alvei]EJW14425.1 hypothetical protein PAV_13c00440 [Paenibacillus alvei DSM 29]MCY9539200.1 hypothetical protein [Paenibacillus alvei]MCY9708747.1 hypothetical protein [Paenibacillus alvei]MCY9737295.1 hypothetical protein [Paenibacillus alvei]MCY9758141.1 hypothetical protein [Paenibacillus alvei]
MTNKEVKTAIEQVFIRYRKFNILNKLNLPEVPAEALICLSIDDIVSGLDPIEKQIIQERYMKQDRISDMQVYTFKLDPPVSAVTYAKIRSSAFEKLLLAFSELGLYQGGTNQ